MTALNISEKKIQAFCTKWKIQTLELFGSVLNEEFDSQSDVDVMLTFESGSTPGLEFVELKAELEEIFKRSVDVVTRKAIESSHNPYRKESILTTAKVIYEKRAI